MKITDANILVNLRDTDVAPVARPGDFTPYITTMAEIAKYIAGTPVWNDVLTIETVTYNMPYYDTVYLFETTIVGNIAASLPTAQGAKGHQLYVENIGTLGATLSLSGFSSETIEDAVTLEIDCGMGKTLYSDGLNWRVRKG